MSSSKLSNTSMSREVIDEETVENMLVDIQQAAKKKYLLIEQIKEVEKKDEEILWVSLNHDISDTAFNLHVVIGKSKRKEGTVSSIVGKLPVNDRVTRRFYRKLEPNLLNEEEKRTGVEGRRS